MSRQKGCSILWYNCSRLFSKKFVKSSTPTISYRTLTSTETEPTTTPLTNSSTSISITEQAVNRLVQLKEQMKRPHLGLRVTVDSGGCHGFSYSFNLEHETKFDENDCVIEKNGARVVLDSTTMEMIKGSKIDFVSELIGSKFVVRDNPQVDSRCGCGVSFNVK